MQYINRAQTTALASAAALVAFTGTTSQLLNFPALDLSASTSYTSRDTALGGGYRSIEFRLDVLGCFAKSLLENTVPLEPEVAKIVNDNFWDIYDRF